MKLVLSIVGVLVLTGSVAAYAQLIPKDEQVDDTEQPIVMTTGVTDASRHRTDLDVHDTRPLATADSVTHLQHADAKKLLKSSVVPRDMPPHRLMEEAATHRYETVQIESTDGPADDRVTKTVNGIRFRVYPDQPIAQFDGVIQPMPQEMYQNMKVNKLESRIDTIDKKLDTLTSKLDELLTAKKGKQ